MRTLCAADLLNLWESASGVHPALGSLSVVCMAYPDLSREQAANLPLAERDKRILQVRRAIFGATGQSIVTCESCGGRSEFELDFDAILAAAQPVPATYQIALDGQEFELRPPTTRDLLSLSKVPLSQAKRTLFNRVLVSSTTDTEAIQDDTIAKVGKELAERDSISALEIVMGCSSCGAELNVPFDAARFFLSELQTWAVRTFQEIHALAKAYGWTESEILNLTAKRRKLYMEMARR